MVNKKMKNKELDELFRITKSTELKETDLHVDLGLVGTDGVDGGTLDLVDEFRLQTEAFHDREIGHETCVILVEGTDLTALELAACTGDTGDDTYLLRGSAERDERESDDEE